MSFNVGDTVRLKSQAGDGPSMTVDEINGGDLTCVWFDKNHIRHLDVFRAATLVSWSDAPLMPSKV